MAAKSESSSSLDSGHHAAIASNADSDVSILIPEPRHILAISEADYVLPLTQLNPSIPPPSDSDLTLPSLCASGPSRSPHRFCSNKPNASHAQHVLDGPRFTSRCGIADDQVFKRHCLKYGAWIIDRPVDPQCTVHVGHADGLAFRCFDAKFLGYPGVEAIKIMHPLCAIELMGLDWDVTRAVAVHLRQYVGKRAVSTSKRKEIVQRAETTSLGMVEREVETRRRERAGAADKSSSPEITNEPQESLSLKDNCSIISLFHKSSSGLFGAFDPFRTLNSRKPGRPDFNTKPCEQRKRGVKASDMHSKQYIVSADPQLSNDILQSCPAGHSNSPRIRPHSACDSAGEHICQDPVYEHDTSSSRPLKRSSTI